MDERRNIALACRFIPYDQWLVTHVDTTWTISQLKSWFIAKCISTSGSTNFSASSLSLAFPFLHVPAKPRSKPPRRPTSPIVFAPEPKGRAISPIRFAPLGPPNPSSSDVGMDGSSEEEGTTIAMGYEEDDEFGNLDSDGELSFSGGGGGGGGRTRLGRAAYLSHIDHRPSTARSVAIEQSQDSTKSHHGHQQQPVLERQHYHQQQRHHHHSRSSGVAAVPNHSTYDIRRLMLIRFSTGQVLEDHFRVDDCSLSPYELIEIHRVGEVLSLPRTVIEQYVQPYWEGWVKSLRVVAREPTHASSKKQKGKRLEKERENEDGSGAANRRRRSKLDWRDRWVFVKDGVLNLRKNRLDPNTAQLLPLDSLIEIRGSEQIGRSFTATSGNPASQQRIICAKFRSRTSSTRFADPPDPANVEELQSPPFKLSSPFNPTHNVSSSSKGKAKISASAWLTAYDPSSFVQPPLPSTHPASIHTKASKHSLNSIPVPPKHSSSSGTLVSTSSKPKIKLEINQNTSTGSVDVRDDELVSWPPTKGKGKERAKGKEKEKESRRVREKEKEKEDRVLSDDGHVAVDDPRTQPGPSRHASNSSTDAEREREPAPDAKDHQLHTHPDVDIHSDDNTNTNANTTPKDNQETTSSDSGSLSSPVFAHSDVDSDADVPEVGVGGFGWGYSYSYGFDRGAAVRKRKEKEGQQKSAVCAPHASLGRAGSGGKDSEVETAGGDEVTSPSVATSATVVGNDEDDGGGAADSSFVVIDANTVDDHEREREKERDSQSRRSAKKKEKSKVSYSYEERPATAATASTIRGHTPRPSASAGAHTRPHHQKASDSEWIVLDLGDDHAYKSFLRILHRHAPHSIFSSFVQSLALSLPAIPALSSVSPSTPNPTPIGDGTPSPSPIVFAPAPADARNRHRHQTSHSYEIAAVGNGTADGDEHDHPHPHTHTQDDSAVTTPRESEIFPMPNSEGTKLLNTFGALPYPEWRVELVTRARKSGMGGVNRAMERFLWGEDWGWRRRVDCVWVRGWELNGRRLSLAPVLGAKAVVGRLRILEMKRRV
ncbi:hypothetical protein PM082_014604 [Marasmius tenuissimus]|nr:hypothetical protein PM082_014604 [Marasmius tenuissimus]